MEEQWIFVIVVSELCFFYCGWKFASRFHLCLLFCIPLFVQFQQASFCHQVPMAPSWQEYRSSVQQERYLISFFWQVAHERTPTAAFNYHLWALFGAMVKTRMYVSPGIPRIVHYLMSSTSLCQWGVVAVMRAIFRWLLIDRLLRMNSTLAMSAAMSTVVVMA